MELGTGAGTGCTTGRFVFGTFFLLQNFTAITIITIIAATTPTTIPAMAPPDKPPLSSSWPLLSLSSGVFPLPGAFVPND